MTPTSIKAILFDLDGTLLDTACDLGTALNKLLEQYRLPTLSHHLIRPAAGTGCRGLLKLGMGIEQDDSRYPELCEKLLNFYETHLTDTTTFFPGMENTLALLDQHRIPWGIVTNKPAKYTDLLAEHLELNQRTSCIISGDSLTNRKPHPEPILYACNLLKQQPRHCLYIGDAKIDMQACKAAGSLGLAALYGYIAAGEDPKQWGADGYIAHPEDILQWVGI